MMPEKLEEFSFLTGYILAAKELLPSMPAANGIECAEIAWAKATQCGYDESLEGVDDE